MIRILLISVLLWVIVLMIAALIAGFAAFSPLYLLVPASLVVIIFYYLL